MKEVLLYSIPTLLTVLGMLAFWGIKLLKPLIVAKLGKTNYERIITVAGILVRSVEQEYTNDKGEDKKNLVSKMLSEEFPNVPQKKISDVIESSVNVMNDSKKKIVTEITTAETTPQPVQPALTPEQIQNIATSVGQVLQQALTQAVGQNGQVQ
jgi:hypothetical protein